jgi:hypothetical protein
MVGLERPQGQPRIFTHPANTNPPSMFDPDITVEGEDAVQADMGGDACCIDAKNKWIEGLREIFGDDYSAPHHADEIFQEVAPFHQVKVVAASAHPVSPNDEIYRAYEEMSCEEFRDVIEQFAGGRPGPYYKANVGNRRNPTSEHYLAKRILQEWDMCEAKSTFGDNMDIYASADTPFLAVWDAIIKESDFQLRNDNADREGDWLGLYVPSKNTATTFLAPFAAGDGWRTLPKPVNGLFEREPRTEELEEWASPPLVRDAEGRPIPALDARRDDVMAQDIIDTDKHETGHEATYHDIHHDRWATRHLHHQILDRWEGAGDYEKDSLYPESLQDTQAKKEREQRGMDSWKPTNYPYESMAGFLLDNPKALQAWLKGEEGMTDSQLMAFQNPTARNNPSAAAHEMAAYTTEFPFHPSYAAGLWLNHTDVPQAAKRKYLQMVEREQKKAGVAEPISGKQIADQLSPKLGWGRRTQALRELMGEPPQSDDAPESKRLLMPAKARIQQNMINAAIGQAYSILGQAGDFTMDPIASREDQHATRVKMATKFAKPLIDAIKRYFKTNDGTLPEDSQKGKRLMDLPEDLRMELGRMQLRGILANMVGQQHDLVDDKDFLTPAMMLDADRVFNEVSPKIHEMIDRDFGGEKPRYARAGMWSDDSAEDIEAYDSYQAKREAIFDEKIEELMNSGEFTSFTNTAPYKENRYGFSEYPLDSAIELPEDLKPAYRRWAERNGINLHYYEGDEYLKQKVAKRGKARKRVPKNKAFYDPVSRAIADAFMQRENKVEARSNFSPSGRKPGLEMTVNQDRMPRGKKWGGELFSGEVGSEYGGKGYWGDYTDTTNETPNSLEEWLNREQKRIPLNDLLDKVVQERLSEIADRKRKENDERIRREREARGDD